MNRFAVFAILAIVYLIYICIGAVVFMVIERPFERDLALQIREQRTKFLTEHAECVSPDELDAFVTRVEDAWNTGLRYSSANTNSTSVSSLWDFGSSLFFTTSLLTTIGYGHVSPLTWTGQLFCLFFALIGIPLTFFFLGTLTYVVSKPSQLLLDYLVVKLDQKLSVLLIRILHLFVLFLLILSLFFLVPAAIFSFLELGWNFFESFYFIFISLTTVGLGDFVPALAVGQGSSYESTRSLYFVCVSFYLLLGLGMMLLLVDTVIKIPEIQRLWEISSMATPASSASTSLNSSRSASPTPSLTRDLLKRSFGAKRKTDEEKELTTSAAPMGRVNYDTMADNENDL